MSLDEQLVGAIKSEDIKKVESLLNEGVNPNAYLPPENAAVFLTDTYGKELAETLLRKTDGNAVTVWHIAASSESEKIIKLFLEKGIDVNARDNYNTPLSKFILKDIFELKESLESFFLFLIFGADVNKEPKSVRGKINNTSKLKECLQAFEQIKAMPHLGKLIEANIKKENAEAIASYSHSFKDPNEIR
ncbi:ankyrin repeat domain-containing protein [Candidatus Mesenet endosymbiont of Phosphuga atrata]|uniref:ankyrin repeat domain-containing protein n=1 Tax=Candidatus Mesenet endosymbiont of Phosphuga atrata TaxID=3066221 RepID=UPI0030D31E41